MTDAAETAPLPTAPPLASGRISLPEGAQCGVHSSKSARFACSRCGTFGCADCLFGGEPPQGVQRIEVCLACASDGLPDPIPWERRKELGWWRAFVDTTKLASMQPTRFYRTPQIEKGPAGGLFYGVAAYTAGQLGLFLSFAVMFILGGAVAGVATEEPVIAGILAGYGCVFAGMTPIFMAQAPVQALLAIVIAGGAEHGTLLLMKRTKVKFEDTLRVIGYAYAPHVWVVIPGCGGLISYVWMLVLEFKAIRETHKCGNDGAALAVFGFRVLLFLFVIGIYGAFIAFVVLYAPTGQPPGGAEAFDFGD